MLIKRDSSAAATDIWSLLLLVGVVVVSEVLKDKVSQTD